MFSLMSSELRRLEDKQIWSVVWIMFELYSLYIDLGPNSLTRNLERNLRRIKAYFGSATDCLK